MWTLKKKIKQFDWDFSLKKKKTWNWTCVNIFILTYVNILENKIEQFNWDFNVHIHFYSNKFNLFFFFLLIPYLQRGYKRKNYKEPKKYMK